MFELQIQDERGQFKWVDMEDLDSSTVDEDQSFIVQVG